MGITDRMRSHPQLTVVSFAALLLAGLGLVAGGPNVPGTVTLDLRTLAGEIDNETDHLAPDSVRSLLRSEPGLLIVDLRDSASFAAGHLPGAVRSTVEATLDLSIERDRPVLLYSAGGIHAAQAWMLFKARGCTRVYTLLGGWDGWRSASDSKATPPPTSTTAPHAPEPGTSPEERSLKREC